MQQFKIGIEPSVIMLCLGDVAATAAFKVVKGWG